MADAFEQACRSLSESPKHWLVTGAAGFIGSHLVEALLGMGQHVTGIDNFATGYRHNIEEVKRQVGEDAWPRFRFVEGDIGTLEPLPALMNEADYVLHQAALGSVPRSIEQPLDSNAANVDGFLRVFWTAKNGGVRRIVYASSSSVYGDSEGLPKREPDIGRPLSPYAVTKRVNELYAGVFYQCYGLESAGLRYFNVFGPRQDPKGAYAAVIPRWIDAMQRGRDCLIFGDGQTSRDFCYVANVVQANILAAVADRPESVDRVYNIAVGEQTSLTELHDLLAAEVRGLKSDAALQPAKYEAFREGDIRHSLADISDAQQYLGYRPRVAVKDGIRETVRWFMSA